MPTRSTRGGLLPDSFDTERHATDDSGLRNRRSGRTAMNEVSDSPSSMERESSSGILSSLSPIFGGMASYSNSSNSLASYGSSSSLLGDSGFSVQRKRYPAVPMTASGSLPTLITSFPRRPAGRGESSGADEDSFEFSGEESCEEPPISSKTESYFHSMLDERYDSSSPAGSTGRHKGRYDEKSSGDATLDISDKAWLTAESNEDRWAFLAGSRGRIPGSSSHSPGQAGPRISLCGRLLRLISVDLYFALCASLKWNGSRVDRKEVAEQAIAKYHTDSKAAAEKAASRPRAGSDASTAKPHTAVAMTEQELKKKCQRMVKVMEARPTSHAIRFLGWSLGTVWRNLFDHVRVDLASLERFREKIQGLKDKKTPILLLPTHKSHVDYLLLSYLHFGLGLPMPHIAAGDNLNIPIVGSIFRRSGSFFIRRSVGGDVLYKSILEIYLRELLKTGACVEFFIEGGRSRSGKVHAPKLGLLGTIIRAVAEGTLTDVILVPIAVDYEYIPEGQGYAGMALGMPKVKESLTGLLGSVGDLFSKKHGDIHIRYSTPLSCKEIVDQASSLASASVDSIHSVSEAMILQGVGNKIGEAISSTAVITSSSIFAAAILSMPNRYHWYSDSELLETIGTCLSLVKAAAKTLRFDGDTRVKIVSDDPLEILAKSLELFKHCLEMEATVTADGTPALMVRVSRVSQEHATELGMYRNMLAHLLVPCAIIAKGLRVQAADSANPASKTADLMVRHMAGEFPNTSLLASVQAILAEGTTGRLIRLLRPQGTGGRFLRHFLAPFEEGYKVFYDTLAILTGPTGSCKRKDIDSHFLKAGAAGWTEGLLPYGENLTLDTPTSALRSLELMGKLRFTDRFSTVVLLGEYASSEYGLSPALQHLVRFFECN